MAAACCLLWPTAIGRVGPTPPRVALGCRAAAYHRWPARPAVPKLSRRAATTMAMYVCMHGTDSQQEEEREREVEDEVFTISPPVVK